MQKIFTKRFLGFLKGKYEECMRNFNHNDAWFPYLVFPIHKFVTQLAILSDNERFFKIVNEINSTRVCYSFGKYFQFSSQ